VGITISAPDVPDCGSLSTTAGPDLLNQTKDARAISSRLSHVQRDWCTRPHPHLMASLEQGRYIFKVNVSSFVPSPLMSIY
jgi:hypothetical protein